MALGWRAKAVVAHRRALPQVFSRSDEDVAEAEHDPEKYTARLFPVWVMVSYEYCLVSLHCHTAADAPGIERGLFWLCGPRESV